MWQKFFCLETGEKEKWRNKGQISKSSPIPIHDAIRSHILPKPRLQRHYNHFSTKQKDNQKEVGKVSIRFYWSRLNVCKRSPIDHGTKLVASCLLSMHKRMAMTDLVSERFYWSCLNVAARSPFSCNQSPTSHWSFSNSYKTIAVSTAKRCRSIADKLQNLSLTDRRSYPYSKYGHKLVAVVSVIASQSQWNQLQRGCIMVAMPV